VKAEESGSIDVRTRRIVGRRVLNTLAAVSLLGTAGCAGTAATPAAEPPAETSGSTAPDGAASAGPTDAAAAEATTAPDGASGQTYKDGEFTQVGSYVSPGGTEKIGVTLTLEKDVVTAVATEPMPTNPTAKLYQERFSGGIQDEIVGKKLDELKVDKVAGSSLTSGGFAEATDRIKSEAQL
jgi:uncharacterized protein with FMN-binding domain